MTKTSKPDGKQTEAELIATAQQAVSSCNWVVGECAVQWTKKYARGRTDADFAALVGLSPDQVYQRRRVWEMFSDVHEQYSSLKWSHFYLALNWDDAPECLQWAEENQATVAEMKAWRRALHGEDLTEEPAPDDWAGDPTVAFVPSAPIAVRDPDSFGQSSGRSTSGERSGSRAGEQVGTLQAVAREGSAGGDYSPFRKNAGSPAQAESTEGVAVAERPRPTADKLLKKMTAALERINEALTAEVIKEARRLPDKQREGFIKAVSDLSTKAARLM